jgi:hypothetical protein
VKKIQPARENSREVKNIPVEKVAAYSSVTVDEVQKLPK